MIKNTPIILGVLICLFVASCAETQSMETQTIHIDLQKLSTKSISDFYQIKEVIPLETNDFSLLAGIDNVFFYDDEIIVGEFRGPAFMVFDRKGNFVKKVDRRGNGPGEYGERLGTVIIDQTDLNSNLIMRKSPRLLFYNFHTWRLVKEVFWTGISPISPFGSLPNGDFLIYEEFSSKNDYFVKLVNPEGNMLKGFLPKPSQVSFTFPALIITPFVFHQNNRIYVLPPITHSVYEYNYMDTLLQERYRFDIKNNPPVDLNRLTQQDIESSAYPIDFYILFLKYIDDSAMIITANTGGNPLKLPITCHVNLKTLQAEVFDSRTLKDEQEEIPLSYFLWTNLGYPVAIVMPEKLVNYSTSRPDSWGYKLKQEIQEDSNPILLVYEKR